MFGVIVTSRKNVNLMLVKVLRVRGKVAIAKGRKGLVRTIDRQE